MWNILIINPMVNTLLWIYSVLGQNFGLAIIFFTLLVRLLTYPLTAQQMKSAQAMQKKNKDNREKLAQEQMKLYKEMGVSPFGSCLPTLIQFPIIIGLYQAIIRALAVTPIQLLDLSNHVYPFINAAALIPLRNYFLWMDLSLPEKDYGFGNRRLWPPDPGDTRRRQYLSPIEIDDATLHNRRPGSPDGQSDEPVYAFIY